MTAPPERDLARRLLVRGFNPGDRGDRVCRSREGGRERGAKKERETERENSETKAETLYRRERERLRRRETNGEDRLILEGFEGHVSRRQQGTAVFLGVGCGGRRNRIPIPGREPCLSGSTRYPVPTIVILIHPSMVD